MQDFWTNVAQRARKPACATLVTIPQVPFTVEALGDGTDATGKQVPEPSFPNQCCVEVPEELWAHRTTFTLQVLFTTHCLLWKQPADSKYSRSCPSSRFSSGAKREYCWFPQ